MIAITRCMMSIGERIQFYRKQKNLSQEQLGQQLFVSCQTVSLWEKNQTQPSIDNLIRLCEIFGISVDTLLKGGEKTQTASADEEIAPSETFEITYHKEDIRKAEMAINKNRIIRMSVATVYLLGLFILTIIKQDPMSAGFAGGIFLTAFLLVSMNLLKLRGMIRLTEQQTMNQLYRYEIYENRMIQRIFRNGEEITVRRILFSEIKGVKQAGNLVVINVNSQLFILRLADIENDSALNRLIRTRTLSKKLNR